MFTRIVWITATIVVALDQLTKALAVHFLEGKQSVQVLGQFLQFSFARNPGAAFSFGTNATIVFTLLAVVAIVFIVRFAPRVATNAWAIVFGGILGGAAGNLIDRLFRSPGVLRGHVVDFIALPHYPMFNLADSAIFCSAVLGIVLTLRGIAPLTAKIES